MYFKGEWQLRPDLNYCEIFKNMYHENNCSVLGMVMWLPKCLNKDHFYDNKPPPIFHISKEIIRPYYTGWIINKKSKWRNNVNAHILRFQQVLHNINIQCI